MAVCLGIEACESGPVVRWRQEIETQLQELEGAKRELMWVQGLLSTWCLIG